MPERAYNHCSDKELLEYIHGEDRFAFEHIYTRYFNEVFIYVAKVISDRDEAKDIVQEIFVSLWIRRMEISEINSLRAYLFSAARFQGFKYIRKNLHKNEYLDALSIALSENNETVFDQYVAKELQDLIDVEIDRLPAKMREIFVLSRNNNFSHKRIADQLMISDKTVKKQINNVLKRFKLIFLANE